MKFFLDHVGRDDWAVRRRIIILSLLWSAALITYLSIWGRTTSLSETVTTNLSILFGSIVGSYVFGAIWDSKIRLQNDSAQSAINQSAPTTTNVDVKL